VPDADTLLAPLPHGRRLAYREYGHPDGAPVVNCHGGLLCGLDAAGYDIAAREAGVRILSPDRPGLGDSTPAPGRTTADWAADVAGLLDHLGIDRVAMLGWSMGGQYALACAARLGDRVTRTVVVAGALPLDDPTTFAQLNPMDRRLTRLAQHHPHVAREVFVALGDVARHRPSAWVHLSERAAPPDEAAALEALPDPGIAHGAAVALSHGDGMVEEYHAWARPWGFAPEDVVGPVTVWQGGADTLVPPAWGRTLADRLPRGRLTAVADAGHFVGFTHTRALLADLV
jgi:pimeloyl-ACP methyl ester carboxylesterase